MACPWQVASHVGQCLLGRYLFFMSMDTHRSTALVMAGSAYSIQHRLGGILILTVTVTKCLHTSLILQVGAYDPHLERDQGIQNPTVLCACQCTRFFIQIDLYDIRWPACHKFARTASLESSHVQYISDHDHGSSVTWRQITC